MHETMKRVFEKTGLEPAELAVKVNVSPQVVTNWSKRGISKQGAINIAKAFSISVDWILTGTSQHSDGEVLDKEVAMWTNEDELPNGMLAIEYLPEVYGALGEGYINSDDSEKLKLWFSEKTLIECNVNPEQAKAIRVQGDSMSPEIVDGQVIAIDVSATRIFDGEIYAFRKNGETKIKYLFKHGDGFKAVSRNDDKLRFPDEIYSAQDIENENIEILGQFWWKSETRRVRR